MPDSGVMLITGASRGIGKHLSEHYAARGYQVVGCSRKPPAEPLANYEHVCCDVCDEPAVLKLFAHIRQKYGRLDALLNNAGVASMNHFLLTPLRAVENIYRTNVYGTFLFCREAAKLMQARRTGRIVNFATVATPLNLEGEAAYASSKAAVISLTRILARELSSFGITVNAIGPTPIPTDLIRAVPQNKLEALLERQVIRRYGEFRDVTNVIDFFLRPESDYITAQVLFLGGVSGA